MNKDNQAQAHQQDITQEVSQDKVVDINNDQQKRERGALPLLEKVNEISIKSMTDDEEERHLDALIRKVQ